MALKYEALLSPIRIRNTILRNRMLSTAPTPHFLQERRRHRGEGRHALRQPGQKRRCGHCNQSLSSGQYSVSRPGH